MDPNFGTFFSFTLKLLKQSQIYLQKIKIHYLIKTKGSWKQFIYSFPSGFLAYNLAVRLILESILAPHTTPRWIWANISLVHFLIINILSELKTTGNILSFGMQFAYIGDKLGLGNGIWT